MEKKEGRMRCYGTWIEVYRLTRAITTSLGTSETAQPREAVEFKTLSPALPRPYKIGRTRLIHPPVVEADEALSA